MEDLFELMMESSELARGRPVRKRRGLMEEAPVAPRLREVLGGSDSSWLDLDNALAARNTATSNEDDFEEEWTSEQVEEEEAPKLPHPDDE